MTANVTIRLSCDTMTWWFEFQAHALRVFTCSETLMEKPEKCVKYVQSDKKRTQNDIINTSFWCFYF